MKRLIAACAVTAALVSTAGAQGFPNQAIKIIVPFTPGGSNDVWRARSRPGCRAA